MEIRSYFLLVVWVGGLFLFSPPCAVTAQAPSREAITLISEGFAVLGTDRARAEEEAILDAKRNAIEKAAGVFLKTKGVGRNYSLEEDTIQTTARGFLKSWKRLPGSEQIQHVGEKGEILQLQIRAEVLLLPLLQKLQDIREAYDDLERPRIRVHFTGDTPEGAAKSALVTALKTEGFEVSEGSAEIVFEGSLESQPTVKLGDRSSPQGIGESIAACRSTLRLSVLSEASEEMIFSVRLEAAGSSFQSNEEAKHHAIEEAGSALLAQNKGQMLQRLLLHCAAERQEGHAVALQIQGLDEIHLDLLEKELTEWRGFRRILGSSSTATKSTLRVLTLLSNREFRRRLTELKLGSVTLNVPDQRGTAIRCSAKNSHTSLPVRLKRTSPLLN